jgi:hypothetical protein
VDAAVQQARVYVRARESCDAERGPHRDGLSYERCGCSACERAMDIHTRCGALIAHVKTYTLAEAQRYLVWVLFTIARGIPTLTAKPLSWIKLNSDMRQTDVDETCTLAMAALTAFEETDDKQPELEVGLFGVEHSDEARATCALIQKWLLLMDTALKRTVFGAYAMYGAPPPAVGDRVVRITENDGSIETAGSVWFKRQRSGRFPVTFIFGKCAQDTRFLRLAVNSITKDTHVIVLSYDNIETMLPGLDRDKYTLY